MDISFLKKQMHSLGQIYLVIIKLHSFSDTLYRHLFWVINVKTIERFPLEKLKTKTVGNPYIASIRYLSCRHLLESTQPSSLASDGPQDSPSKKIFAMKTTLVLSVVLAAAAAKFCPGERNGNQCRAGE